MAVRAVILCQDKDINNLLGVKFRENYDSGAPPRDGDAYNQTDCRLAAFKTHNRVL